MYPIIPQADICDAHYAMRYDLGHHLLVAAVFSSVALPQDLLRWRAYGDQCLILWHIECGLAEVNPPVGVLAVGRVVHSWLKRNFSFRHDINITTASTLTSLFDVDGYCLAALAAMEALPFPGPLDEMQVLILVCTSACEPYQTTVVAYRRFGPSSFTCLADAAPGAPRDPGGLATHATVSTADIRLAVSRAKARGPAEVISFRLPLCDVRATRTFDGPP
jgi:hypothetical protein